MAKLIEGVDVNIDRDDLVQGDGFEINPDGPMADHDSLVGNGIAEFAITEEREKDSKQRNGDPDTAKDKHKPRARHIDLSIFIGEFDDLVEAKERKHDHHSANQEDGDGGYNAEDEKPFLAGLVIFENSLVLIKDHFKLFHKKTSQSMRLRF